MHVRYRVLCERHDKKISTMTSLSWLSKHERLKEVQLVFLTFHMEF